MSVRGNNHQDLGTMEFMITSEQPSIIESRQAQGHVAWIARNGWSVVRHATDSSDSPRPWGCPPPSFIRDAQPFLSWKDVASKAGRSITWNTTNGLGSTRAVCESPKSKSIRMRRSHSKKQKSYSSARQSDNPFFGQEQRQSTFNHRSRRQGKGDDRIWALGSICKS